MQDEHPPRGLVLSGADILGEDALAEALGEVLMLVLGLGELDRSRTDASRPLSAALR
jgi:hypothetical protein